MGTQASPVQQKKQNYGNIDIITSFELVENNMENTQSIDSSKMGRIQRANFLHNPFFPPPFSMSATRQSNDTKKAIKWSQREFGGIFQRETGQEDGGRGNSSSREL